MKKTVTAFLLIGALVTGSAGWSCADEKACEVAILYTNDAHCSFDVSEECLGFAGIAGYKAITQTEYGKENVALVDVGDFIQGEAIGTISDGKYPAQIMRYLGYDAATFGNHEFDYGMEALLGKEGLAAGIEYLSCNFMNTVENKRVCAPYVIKDYAACSVAFLGISTPETLTKSTPAYFQNERGEWIYDFCGGDEGRTLYAAVQTAIDEAKREGADYVVALAHLGIEESSAPYRSTDVIQNTNGLDVVLDGHSHSKIASRTERDKEGNEVLLTSTGSKLTSIGKLVVNTNGTQTKKDDVVTASLVSAAEVNALCVDQPNALSAAAFLKEDIQAGYEERLAEVVAISEVELSLTDENGARRIRNGGMPLGDIVADAYRTAMGADIAFANGGGIRAGLPMGDVTYGDILAVQPYGNTTCLVEATGQEIVDALEMGSRATQVNAVGTDDAGAVISLGESGGFLHVSGLIYTIDPAVESTVELDEKGMFVRVAGARRVKEVKIWSNDRYVDIDLAKTYTVASHNYMIKQGGDGMNMFVGNRLLLDETKLDNAALIEYLQNRLNGRITAEHVRTLGNRITILGR